MTEHEYIEHLEALEALGYTHPLMATLRAGWSKANAMYMAHVLKTMPVEEEATNAEETAPAVGLKVLYVRKSRLFGQRASLSNKMCDLPEDAAFDKKRAKYSDEIQAVQGEIEHVMREIADMESGEMPENPEKPELPTSEADLLRRLASLRASRSRQRRLEKSASGKNLKKCQAELARLENLITHVETALAEHT